MNRFVLLVVFGEGCVEGLVGDDGGWKSEGRGWVFLLRGLGEKGFVLLLGFVMKGKYCEGFRVYFGGVYRLGVYRVVFYVCGYF